MLNKILRLRKISHLGIIKSYNVVEQLQSKNIPTLPIQVSSFMTLKSLTVNHFTGVNGKKMDEQKERRERRREGKRKREEGKEGGKEGSWMEGEEARRRENANQVGSRVPGGVSQL